MFREIPLKDLHWNRRTGMAVFNTEEKLEKYIKDLEKSIKKDGVQIPPRIRKAISIERNDWGKEYRVLRGNHRVEVAKRLGWDKILCEVLDG